MEGFLVKVNDDAPTEERFYHCVVGIYNSDDATQHTLFSMELRYYRTEA